MGRSKKTDLGTAVEARTRELGRSLWGQLERRTPSVFESRWWEDRILSWAMDDEAIKVQMFRFVDVLPMLRTHESVARHLHEYFEEVRDQLPLAPRLALDVPTDNMLLGKALSYSARTAARRMAQRFIAGASVSEVLQSIAKVRKRGFAFTLDLLGEAVISSREADVYQQAYLDLITGLAPEVNGWPENVLIDRDHEGPIPRVNVSIKLSALCSHFMPVDPAGTAEIVKSRLRPLLRAAREHDAFVNVDMEHYAYKDLTLEIFKQVLLEDEFRDFPDAGIVVQTYLPDAERDLASLLKWVQQRGTPVWVRLVKGAYWDYETVMARYRNWPIPVYQQKWQSDDNFERQTRFLMENYRWLRPAVASHNLRSLAHALAWQQELNLPSGAAEVQMLYGMGTDEAQIFSEMGHRVRVYTPFGELIPGMAYLVRRLLENTSNDSFLRQSYSEAVSVEDLMMKPADIGDQTPPLEDDEVVGFVNEPHTDFSRDENRDAMQEAIEEVENQLGGEYPLVINGRAIETKARILSRNPSHTDQIVGSISSATPAQAAEAVETARRTFREWSRLETNYRAEYIEIVAAEMRNHRLDLAAWEVFECGKTWAEADADVAEAIDFCMYYAAEMRRLDHHHHCDVAGEDNDYFYRPRGVVVVIAPWNFPLAILTGMTVAALVTGNTVIMKPAEQSSVVAAKLMDILHHAGIPDGVVNYLPGVGEEVGPELVGSPDVDVIAFTGSRAVGLEINQVAARTDPRQENVKKVLAEMGGKNAIIVDEDADLDEAVLAVVHSAFGYSGQKCSACSRAIVLEPAYDAFIERLTEAVKSLEVGPAELPGTQVGPVIDEEALNRVRDYIAIGNDECTPLVATDVADLAKQGHYVGPHVFTDVEPDSRLSQDEIFGPVLAVIKVKNLDQALDVANNTDYALTGGLFSRSPVNLRRARQEYQVGNLYLNREITGALVQRHPFGGYKMSGIGSKAGGPDYLLQFVVPVNITENTMRRGFAPPSEED
ncbi:MAG: L-glutamate gamma-semialdehyde dehydrogenase [Planctomycetaceae bacterium]|nr:L-glutamate gamma-semialdehyde dehydrogenase [Planctomycetaceae bacterium]